MTRPDLALALPGRTPPAGPDFGQLLGRVVRRLHYVVALSLLGTVLAHEVQVRLAPRYSSAVSILLDPRRPGSFGADSEFSNLYVDNAKIASVAAIITSANMLGRVVDAEGLADDPGFGAAPPSALRRWLAEVPFLHLPPAQSATPEARRAIALAALTRAVKVTREGLTYVVVVDVSAAGPVQAQRLTQAVADAYLDDQSQTKAAATARDHAWLTARLRELGTELLRNEQAVEAVRRKYGLAETDRTPGSTVELQAVTDVNAELLRADTEVAALRARYQQAERILRSGGDLQGSAEMVASPVIQELRKQEVAARRQLADLQARYTKANPDVIHAERDLRAIETQVATEMARVVGNLRNEFEAATARRAEVAGHLARITGMGTDAASPAGDGRVLLRQAQRIAAANNTLYDALLAKLRDVEQQQTRVEAEARIISPAGLPASPSFPNPIIFLGGGAALGTLLGGLGAIAVPQRSQGFGNAAAAEKALSLPVLGVLPRLGWRLARPRRSGGSGILAHIQANPLSQYSECLRALRTSLLAACGPGACVIQVTSARVGEGKSTVAASLAVSVALAGLRTALVDIDIRHASIDRMFDLPHVGDPAAPHAGGEGDDELVQRHPDMPLTIVNAGAALGLRPDAIASQQFADMIRSAARTHDVVILDSPPVLAVSDPLVIARLADATLLVAAARTTPPAQIEQAAHLLHGAEARLVGVVLNKATLSKTAQYGAGFGLYGGAAERQRRLSAR